MTANARISINIDADVKQNAQRMFGEMGLDLTTAIDLFLRTALLEGRIPFSIRTQRAYREETHRAYINAELDKSMIEAADPDTQWLTHVEMKERLSKRREARHHV